MNFLVCLLAVFLTAGSGFSQVEAPVGVRFLKEAESLEKLRAESRPDLAWQDRDGAEFFLWAKPAKTKGGYSFELNRAYKVSRSGKTSWAFLDAKSGEGLDFQDPVQQFLLLKHVREKIEYPVEHTPDGNHSFAELLSRREDGAKVFKLVYSSIAGPGSHQEEIKTYLIYIRPDGKCVLAAKDLGREGSHKMGWIGFNRSTEMKVVWGEDRQTATLPFFVKLTVTQSTFGRSEDFPNYESHQDGEFTGSFPLKLKINSAKYVVSDGKQTVKELANALMEFHSPWMNAEWVNAQDEVKITQLWQQELLWLNPSLSLETPAPKDQRIIVPEEQKYNAVEVYPIISARHPDSQKR